MRCLIFWRFVRSLKGQNARQRMASGFCDIRQRMALGFSEIKQRMASGSFIKKLKKTWLRGKAKLRKTAVSRPSPRPSIHIFMFRSWTARLNMPPPQRRTESTKKSKFAGKFSKLTGRTHLPNNSATSLDLFYEAVSKNCSTKLWRSFQKGFWHQLPNTFLKTFAKKVVQTASQHVRASFGRMRDHSNNNNDDSDCRSQNRFGGEEDSAWKGQRMESGKDRISNMCRHTIFCIFFCGAVTALCWWCFRGLANAKTALHDCMLSWIVHESGPHDALTRRPAPFKKTPGRTTRSKAKPKRKGQRGVRPEAPAKPSTKDKADGM